MKSKLLSMLFGLALVVPASGQPATAYVNDAIVNCPPDIPPQVDALNFVNNNFFSINFSSFLFVNQLYETANTLNYTNVGTMIGNNGFRFDTSSSGPGGHRMANSFYNPGTISAGSVNNTNAFFGFFFGFNLPKLIISATNIIDGGTNIVGVDGLFKATGKNVDFNRGVITMEGFENTPSGGVNNFLFDNLGIFTAYAAAGTNVMVPASQFESFPPSSPSGLVLPGATFYVRQSFSGTNRFVQAVFLSDTNSAISNNVYFGGQINVEWSARMTNLATGSIFTNYLYLFDRFLTSGSNILSGAGIPVNYSFFRSTSPFNLGTPAVPSLPAGIFNNTLVTNESTDFGALVAPTTALAGSLPGDPITNLPGRIELFADEVLNLTRTKISGLNYVRLQSTNHFASSSRAQITVPYSDISLGSTNGSLVITNLLVPTVPRFTGEVDLWSGRWTNNDAFFQSAYHVLFVDSRLSPVAKAQVQDLYLRSTNMVLSDVMNVLRSFLFDGENLTLTTNGPGSQAAIGELNILNTAITWSSATPRLKNLTNNGAIRMQNAVFFGGSRTTPYFTTNFDEPYLSMVNHGEIQNQGTLIWANYFENTGSITPGIGSVTLQSLNALLKDGTFPAGGDISLTSGSLVVSNHTLQAGRTLSFTVANLLDDGSLFNSVEAITNKNHWTAGNGINLLTRPAQASLLGTTISATASPLREVISRWAADDPGCSAAGFSNNAAVGRLVLNGGDDSLFTFTGTGVNNALYVDYLELQNFATNRDAMGNFIGLNLDSNMKIYFAQAVANGQSIAEKLDGKNGGSFCWVTTYTGFYSSTNLVYPDGTTNTFNAALVGSCNLDSDGDGLVNCSDPTPILRPQDLGLKVSVTNQPASNAEVSWQSGPYAANYVYVKNALGATNWQLLTNFVSSPSGGRVSVLDPINPASPRYYRVRVDPSQP